MTVASPNAFFEPQITFRSIEEENVILHASPEWKQKLIAFLKYADTTNDAEVHAFVASETLHQIITRLSPQLQKKDALVLSKLHLVKLSKAFLALNILGPDDFYDYPANDFDRLHDDIFPIYETVFNEKISGFTRIKTDLSERFDG